jgi:hypothetical protein
MRFERAALGRRQLLEDFGLLFRAGLRDVGGVVGIEIADALGDRWRQLFEDFLADRVVDLGERGEVELAPISSTKRGRSSDRAPRSGRRCRPRATRRPALQGLASRRSIASRTRSRNSERNRAVVVAERRRRAWVISA